MERATELKRRLDAGEDPTAVATDAILAVLELESAVAGLAELTAIHRRRADELSQRAPDPAAPCPAPPRD